MFDTTYLGNIGLECRKKVMLDVYLRYTAEFLIKTFCANSRNVAHLLVKNTRKDEKRAANCARQLRCVIRLIKVSTHAFLIVSDEI